MHTVAGREPSESALVQEVACVEHDAALSVQHVEFQCRIDDIVLDRLPLGHDAGSPVVKPGLQRKYRCEPVIRHHIAIPTETFSFFDIESLTTLETGMEGIYISHDIPFL